MELVWDEVGSRLYETGVDHGVLYIPNGAVYDDGVAWNGLVTVTESPSGAEASPQYADNIKYLNLYSAEEFGATIEAFTYPEQFNQFDGISAPVAGVLVGQQSRRAFGLSYRTKIGNDVDGSDHGYKLHLVWGATATPSEKAYTTQNESPEPITFSWELTTSPVAVPGYDLKPTASMVINSTEVDAGALANLEQILYGAPGVDPRLPLPAEVIGLFEGTTTVVAPLAAPAYNDATDTLTIPATVGVIYSVNGEDVAAGDIVLTEDAMVTARAADGYILDPASDNDWYINHTP
jgi:hypothetical protein